MRSIWPAASYRALLIIGLFGLGGCAAPIIAGITLGDISLVGGAISTATTGKGLSDHALSYATGKNCDVVEGILRKDRDICEKDGSEATKKDFKGFFAGGDAPDADLATLTIPAVLPHPKPAEFSPPAPQLAANPPQ